MVKLDMSKLYGYRIVQGAGKRHAVIGSKIGEVKPLVNRKPAAIGAKIGIIKPDAPV